VVYEIALKSANETRYWLELLRDAKLVDANVIAELSGEATEIANMLGAGVIKLKEKLT
jgi:four helix bundle protein